ncbi:MAG TPA: hypothetical protein VFU22_01520 [Roseiflexaceae bacterium]|nr:hypothetical protein [Roseiflexaceae bacterium]
MQRVTEQVDAAYLQQPPPRRLSPAIIMNLLSDHIFERPLKMFLDPLVIISIVALMLLFALRASTFIRLVPVLIIVIRLLADARQIWRDVSEDLALLRNGLTLRAHVLGLRPYRTTMGAIDGALLDCAIPVAPRRTYVGSVWLASGAEALRLERQGRVEVICLPRTPGTWRVIEDVKSDIRYDRMGPIQQIPHDE